MPNARRALLLFALVLGVSAIVATVLQPEPRNNVTRGRPAEGRGTSTRPEPSGRPAPPPRRLSLVVGEKVTRLSVESRTALSLVVSVPRPGQVELTGLGLVASAEPLTPAQFEVSPLRPGRYAVVFTPAGAEEPRRVGALVVRR